MYDVLYVDNDPCVSLCPQGVHKPHTYRPYHHTLTYIDIEYLISICNTSFTGKKQKKCIMSIDLHYTIMQCIAL